MLVGRQKRQATLQQRRRVMATQGLGAARRGVTDTPVRPPAATGALHPFTRGEENARLFAYESRVKDAFDRIEPVLRRIAQYQHRPDFAQRAEAIAREELGFSLPAHLLDNTWVAPLDMPALYACCVFETFRRFADDFYHGQPLARANEEREFQAFIEDCGFHILDVSPCADGRLAHIIRYVLRLPHGPVRRRSYAGAMFDVEDSLQKWIETEFLRQREAVPNDAGQPTRYLKVGVYHYSSSQPKSAGCAAHGGDVEKAARGALDRLNDFRQAVENSFCCGASIDLLLIGLDTDNDAIRVHLPDADGHRDITRHVDVLEAYEATRHEGPQSADSSLQAFVRGQASRHGITVPDGMVRLMARLLLNNISQVDYVRSYLKGRYSDIDHYERFIGMGIGFEEVQLRNLTYFAYLKTVEEGAKDIDVGLKIFTGLNIERGVPAPVVIRYDYHGNVPGSRERAIARCQCLQQALRERFADLTQKGLLHTLLVVRDVSKENSVEVVGSSLEPDHTSEGH